MICDGAFFCSLAVVVPLIPAPTTIVSDIFKQRVVAALVSRADQGPITPLHDLREEPGHDNVCAAAL